jgi:mono/diheme cytochrome c family protein
MGDGMGVIGQGRRVLVGAIFVASALLGSLALGACDSGSSSGGGNSGGGGTTGGEPTAAAHSGETIFAQYCNVCHPGGNRGAGPSLILEAPRLSDAQIKSTVRNGKDRMPGFGPSAISDADLDGLVQYIRAMK